MIDLNTRSYTNKQPLSHSHSNFYQVILPLQGQMHLDIEGLHGSVQRSHWVVVPPQYQHSYWVSVPQNRFLVLDLPKMWLEASEESTHIVLPNQIFRPMSERSLTLSALLQSEIRQGGAHDPLILQALAHYVSATIMQSASQEQSPERSSKRQVAHIVHDYLSAHALETLDLPSLAQQFAVSVGHMQRSFRAHYDLSIVEYLQELRIQHACKLLRESNSSILVISERIGFESQSYFSRLFKRKMGCTPQQYRAESGKNPF